MQLDEQNKNILIFILVELTALMRVTRAGGDKLFGGLR